MKNNILANKIIGGKYVNENKFSHTLARTVFLESKL